MQIDRRDFLLLSTATVASAQVQPGAPAAKPEAWQAQWIWYPGQLAAWRHARRMRLAMQRCTTVGSPANFRQPLTDAYFRQTGTADRDIELKWAGPVGRCSDRFFGRASVPVIGRSRILDGAVLGSES